MGAGHHSLTKNVRCAVCTKPYSRALATRSHQFGFSVLSRDATHLVRLSSISSLYA